MGRLGGDMGAHQVMGNQRAERLRDQRRRAGVESVQHDKRAVRRRAEDNAGDAAELEAADLRKQINPVRRVGAVDFQRLAHDLDFHLQPLVGNIRAAPGRLLRRQPAGGGDDAGRGGSVGDSHFPRQEAADAFRRAFFRQLDTGLDGAHGFVSRHGRTFREIFRAEGDLPLNQSGNP